MMQYEYSTFSTSVTQSELDVEFYEFDNNYCENYFCSTSATSSSRMEEDTDVEPASQDVPLLNTEDIAEPKDRCKIVLLTFTLLGFTTLFPWNFFITANDYWIYKFRNVSEKVLDPCEKTELQASFASYLSIASNIPTLIMLSVNTALVNRLPQELRNGCSLVAMVIIFIITVALTKVNTDGWQLGFFALTMVTVVAVNVAAAVFQGGIIGLVSLFPPAYMHGLVTGQAVGGIFAAIAQIIALAGHIEPLVSGFGFFLCAVIVLLITLFSYLGVHRMEFFVYHTECTTKISKKMSSLTESDPHLSFFEICRQFYMRRFFIPVTSFLLFNIGDFSGRIIGGWLTIPPKFRLTLLSLTCLRVAFVPLFMLCNAHPRNNLPVIFDSDVYYISFVAVFSVTNGYFFSNAMMHAPKQVSQRFREQVGSMMVMCLGLGLALGSVSSIALVKML
ncbi:equilibrative nucleoside transporter 3-like [Limulus polyphemus]|uniref:Equilibrative nucleoside transporter 3-like n=1 Tax=Limulus polyphemus TaxID=6850 RepID=A0ABM1TEJ6_LIMPO|nr:equilibrative nucleoside transporter 3-like [Limulus polyphemus]